MNSAISAATSALNVGVTTFNGRTGAVTPASGDYTADMVGAVPTTRKINGKTLSSDITLTASDIGASGVGQSMAGQVVNPQFTGSSVTAEEGSEIFNDYRKRTFDPSGIPNQGSVASGLYAHAEGSCTTAMGDYSHAEGLNSTASGYCSHTEGEKTVSSGRCSHTEGTETTASTFYAHAEGFHNTASGEASHVEGRYTQATAQSAHAEGDTTIASGLNAHAEGQNNEARGEDSHVEGEQCVASGAQSHAEGYRCTASTYHTHAGGRDSVALGYNSFAHGDGALSEYWAQMSVGKYNVQKNPNANNFTADLFVVGKGSSSARANVFRVDYTGVYGVGAFNASGADYAELFEWTDRNPKAEDRAGRFVTLDGEKIRMATPQDEYILGIVSGNPSVVGDVHDDQWAGMFLTDIFGRPLWEDVEVPDEVDKEGNIIMPAHTEHRQRLNPAYDNTQIYQPRTERPEWDAVGLLGKLVAVDDGTCQVNGWAEVGKGGKATASPERTKYRVMARLDDTHIRIMIL